MPPHPALSRKGRGNVVAARNHQIEGEIRGDYKSKEGFLVQLTGIKWTH